MKNRALFSRSAQKVLGVCVWGGGGVEQTNKTNFDGRPYTCIQDLRVYLEFQSTIFVMTSLIIKIML